MASIRLVAQLPVFGLDLCEQPAYISPMSGNKQAVSPNVVREQWQSAVEQLVNSISAWAKELNWSVDRQEKQLSEALIGTYAVDMLNILTSQGQQGQLVVEPIAQGVSGADGRVDLYAWPSLNKVRLLLKQGKWSIRTDSELDWPKEWSRETFQDLARNLVAT